MKLSALLIIPLLLTGTPAFAYGASGRTCYKEVWREEYVPGNRWNRGYVRRWKDTVRIPCHRRGRGHHYHPQTHHPRPHHTDNNSCVEGSIIGGILGAGAGAALSRGDGRWIGVPLGIVGGALVGCQVDGG